MSDSESAKDTANQRVFPFYPYHQKTIVPEPPGRERKAVGLADLLLWMQWLLFCGHFVQLEYDFGA